MAAKRTPEQTEALKSLYSQIENSFVFKIPKLLESSSFKSFQLDYERSLESWQYYEPPSISFQDRFNLDKEAYLKEYFGLSDFDPSNYNEKTFAQRLIKNLQKAKHPYFIEYRNFLEDKLNKTEKFKHSPDVQKENAKKGGKARAEYSYARFKKFVTEKKLSIDTALSNEMLSIHLNKAGYKISPKTAGNYKKRYLLETPNR